MTIYTEIYDENNRYDIETYLLPEKIKYTYVDINKPLCSTDELQQKYDTIDEKGEIVKKETKKEKV